MDNLSTTAEAGSSPSSDNSRNIDETFVSGLPPRFPPPPPQRSDTSSTSAADTCRICRSEATPSEPLFHPCKCSGSIKHVHQECLMEWLSHSNKKHCELCKTPFRFTKLYDANMPTTLPWGVFIRRALVHVWLGLVSTARGLLVGSVWLGAIPWVVRWVWRWFFWFADMAWAREAFVQEVLKQKGLNGGVESHTVAGNGSVYANVLQRLFQPSENATAEPMTLRFAKGLLGLSSNITATGEPDFSSLGLDPTTSFSWPLTTPSLLSGFPHLAEATPSPRLNRLILDVLEGQMITCVVITGFILVFLIREWVVQQQPLVNIDNVQQQLREAADRVQAETERIQQQRELLDEARRSVEEMREARAMAEGWQGMNNLTKLIDEATEYLRQSGERDEAQRQFSQAAMSVVTQIRAGVLEGVDIKEFTDNVFRKFNEYSDEEKKRWQEFLAVESRRRVPLGASAGIEGNGTNAESSSKRPVIPGRDALSRPIEVHRLLTEQEEQLRKTDIAIREAVTDLPPRLSKASDKRSFDPLPITNAGPDAKVNIKRSGEGKMREVPAPTIQSEMLEKDEALASLRDEVNQELEESNEESSTETNTCSTRSASAPPSYRDNNTTQTPAAPPRDNPFHPEGTMPERRNSESFGNRVASVFREEFGLDEAEELEELRNAGMIDGGDVAVPDRGESASATHQALQNRNEQLSLVQKIADWFWGDIEAPQAEEAAPAANEERQGGDDVELLGGDPNEAPFVPVRDGHPVVNREEEAPPPAPIRIPIVDVAADANVQQPVRDPEVLAAAQQAGVDAEAIEDAEDLEGIFELLGMQGPLIGLFQTSAFCMLLVACTIGGAVIAPYLFGKLVLSFLNSPVYFLVKMPLQTASFIADFIVDISLILGGWIVVITALAADFLLSAAEAWAPLVANVRYLDTVIEFARGIAAGAGTRLQGYASTAFTEPKEGMMWTWSFLAWSVHAHAELIGIGQEVHTVLQALGTGITLVVETISSGRVGEMTVTLIKSTRHLPALARSFPDIWREHTLPIATFLRNLSHGALTFSTPQLPSNPTLVWWSTTDRALAILTGYTALAALAALYVALDTPITKSASGRHTEKSIRDALRQAGGVLKVILIISIEMLVFPLYCGMLLDLAFLPLFREATVAGRWRWAGEKPYTFCFVHWFVGTCYMFHFALFVGMCRKILRKGVLWFVRDPDDPTFHPVRDVLERNVATQLRKIAFSALVYGALVILCLGGVVWACVRMLEGVFPIVWASTEPTLEFPVNLFLYNIVTPLVFRVAKPTDAMSGLYAWWLRKCARALRLSHFLFGDRKIDEEGAWHVKDWHGFVASYLRDAGDDEGIYFERDGKYVLTPCNDQYRPPKPGEAFLHVEDDDVYIADREGKKNDHFAKVYVPPYFRIRVSLFVVCLWLFSAVTGLCVTIVPLVVGRKMLAATMSNSSGVNDIYAYGLGAYTLAALLFAGLKGKPGAAYLASKAKSIDAAVWMGRMKRFATALLKCVYFYGFLGVVMPIIFALLLQFYFLMPLHTWTTSIASSAANSIAATNDNSTLPSSTNLTTLLSPNNTNTSDPAMHVLTESTFHILQGYALGLIYGRIAMRAILTAPASRATEAFRRITAAGYLNPNPRLATRFFILPAILISTIVLILPPLAARVGLSMISAITSEQLHEWLDFDTQTKIYRYSYALAASCVVLFFAGLELGRATQRWRARIRDEVYLVGERLHNFGERRPPEGSNVVRKSRG